MGKQTAGCISENDLADSVEKLGDYNIIILLTLYCVASSLLNVEGNHSWSAISLLVSNWFNLTGNFPKYKTLRLP